MTSRRREDADASEIGRELLSADDGEQLQLVRLSVPGVAVNTSRT